MKALDYSVALTVTVRPGRSPKPHVPEIAGVTWRYWRTEFAHDGYVEYHVGAMLNQEQMDEFVDRTEAEMEGKSGGVIGPEGFPHTWAPAVSYTGNDGVGYAQYHGAVVPFPAGLRRPASYRFGKWHQFEGRLMARYGPAWWDGYTERTNANDSAHDGNRGGTTMPTYHEGWQRGWTEAQARIAALQADLRAAWLERATARTDAAQQIQFAAEQRREALRLAAERARLREALRALWNHYTGIRESVDSESWDRDVERQVHTALREEHAPDCAYHRASAAGMDRPWGACDCGLVDHDDE